MDLGSRRRQTGITWVHPRPISDQIVKTGSLRRKPTAKTLPQIWSSREATTEPVGISGQWMIEAEKVVLHEGGGSIAMRFHARNAHLVLSRRGQNRSRSG